MPDIEERFWKQYKDRGLVVVALNAHDKVEQIGQVQEFIKNLGVSFDVGLEQSETYRSLTQNFEGLNPFPVDVIVGKDGRIAYIAREYDPEAMSQTIDRLLSE